jgi:hypothetical protein
MRPTKGMLIHAATTAVDLLCAAETSGEPDKGAIMPSDSAQSLYFAFSSLVVLCSFSWVT